MTLVAEASKKKLLSREAFRLRGEVLLIDWSDIFKAFPGRPEEGGEVSEEEFRAFIEKWCAEHPDRVPGYLLTRDAHREWKKRGGSRLLSEREIRKKTGKRWGVTLDELIPILDEVELETGFELDGPPIECFIGKHRFQPTTRVLFRNGAPVRGSNGYERVGNYIAFPVQAEEEKEFVIVAVCQKCKWQDEGLKRLRLYPKAETEDYVARMKKRAEAAKERAAEAAARKEQLLRAVHASDRVKSVRMFGRRGRR